MAQINFPVATADGQTFEAPNGVIYTYVGTPPNGYWSGTFQDQSLQTLDGRYLKLDASNDPLTDELSITASTPRITFTDTDTGAVSQINANSSGGNFGINVDIDSVYDTNNGSSLIVFNRGTESFRVRGDGKVTVGGNPNPAAMFDVKGDIMVGAAGIEGGQITLRGVDGSKTVSFWDVYRDDQIRFFTNQDDVKFSIGSYSSGGEIALRTNNQERLYVTSDGNVGIGETNPERQLHVNGGSNVNNILVESTNNSSYITFKDANTTAPTSVRVGSSADQLRILTGGTDSMRIDQNGNVGIGTTTPQSELDISKDSGLSLRLTRTGASPSICELKNAGNMLQFVNNKNGFEFRTQASGETQPSAKVSIDDTGNLILQNAGQGISFNDHGNGTNISSNLLDDYEDGTWTPTFVGGGSEGDGTYQNRGGKYVKVGDLVHVSCFIRFSNKGNISGDLSVGGLPFVQGSTGTASRASLCIGSLGSWNTRPTGCVIEERQNYAKLNNNQDSSGNTLTEAAIANNSFIFLTGTYRTS